jgi:hypothetical protein
VTIAAAPKIANFSISVIFTAAIMLSAVLIFWMEPLFPKMMLPGMGGTPATWVTALMFYQAVLLLGYSYSFLLTRWAIIPAQAVIHLMMLATAAFVLPPALPSSSAFLETMPVLHVLYMLTIGVGLPLFALAATAPLLQHFFSGTSHPAAHDPYFLYAASNVGSLSALVAYPVLIEPRLGNLAQTRLWTIGFLAAAGTIFACIALSVGTAGTITAVSSGRPAATPTRDIERRWMWLLLAAVPSSLLSGTTSRITSDIAAGPLFWVIPLALYLLTFVMAFSRRRFLPMRFALLAQPLALAPVVIAAFGGQALIGDWPTIAATLILLFLSAYICHVRLADGRPGPERTTEFYLIMALGGLAGGTFNALIAPNIFRDIVEYPLALILAVALRPSDVAPGNAFNNRDLLIPCGAGLVAGLIVLASPAEHFRLVVGLLGLAFSVGLAATAAVPLRFAVGLAVVFLVSHVSGLIDPPLYRNRNFFGVVKVLHDRAKNTNVLMNGTIVHGQQARDLTKRRELVGYYHDGSPYSDGIAALAHDHGINSAAVIGLGAGTVACSGPPDTRWTFYEINPVDVTLATEQRYFSFLADCQPHARVLTGDGRVLLAGEQQKFDLIVLDAFSSDSIPIHLLTIEAFSMYLEKLRPNGMILANISNRFVNLNPIFSAAATRLGLSAAWRLDGTRSGLSLPSKWVAMTRTREIIAPLVDEAGWTLLQPNTTQLWTDDRSDLFGLLLSGLWRRT